MGNHRTWWLQQLYDPDSFTTYPGFVFSSEYTDKNSGQTIRMTAEQFQLLALTDNLLSQLSIAPSDLEKLLRAKTMHSRYIKTNDKGQKYTDYVHFSKDFQDSLRLSKAESEAKLKKIVSIVNGMKTGEWTECWEFLRRWLRESTERPNLSIDSLTRGNFNEAKPGPKLLVLERLREGAPVGQVPVLVSCGSFMSGFF